MDVTERPLRRLVRRMSHRVSVSLSLNLFGVFLLLKLAGSKEGGMLTRRKEGGEIEAN